MNNREAINNYFNRQCSPEEMIVVEQWIIKNIKSKELDEIFLEILHSCPETDSKHTKEAYERLSKKIGISTPKNKTSVLRLYLSRVAAILIIGLIGYTAYFIGNKNGEATSEWIEAYAPIGESLTVKLPDSSVIELKSGSKLMYTKEFSSKSRNVYLAGEAYAEITKDANRPFTMHCNDIKVCVLGTRFNVQSYVEDSEVEVRLYEGLVRLESNIAEKDDTTMMSPGNIVKIDKTTGKKVKYNISNLRHLSGSNSFYFIDKQFGSIALQLERHFNKRIIIDSKELADSKYYAIFVNNENLDQILNQLNSSRQMKISYINDNVISITKNK